MRKCEICGETADHEHHVFFGSDRKLSEKHGLVADLCVQCHLGNKSVHRNRELDLALKERYQAKFEESNAREDFLRIFGRNYLD